MNKKSKIAIGAIAILGLLSGVVSATIFTSVYDGEDTATVYIDRDDTPDSVTTKLEQANISTTAFGILGKVRSYNVKTGRYKVEKGMDGWRLFQKLRYGQQDPLNMTVPSVRTLDRLAGTMSRKIMLDSLTIYRALQDKEFIAKYGYYEQTLPALFIPETYQVFWDISLDKLFERLVKENKKFWNEERLKKADALKLTPVEVSTLASIVDEETANTAEKPMVAELYINRLEKGMLLQADPTVKRAVGDWSLRRVLNSHLMVDNPYNTYKYAGLPPGPIRVPSIAGIDAVLNHANHDYIYMCAKEDFSGTHNFAVSYAEHQQNAKRYINALNARGIK